MNMAIQKLSWSPQQQAFLNACEHGKSSIIVIAVAGSGKTTVCIEGAKRLKGATAMVAFNTKIAAEIKDRLASAGLDWKKARGGTAHSFGYGVYVKSYKLAEKPSSKKVPNLLAAYCAEHPGERFIVEYAKPIATLISFAKQAAIGVLGRMEDKQLWRDLIDHHDIWDRDDDEAGVETLIATAIKFLKLSNEQTDIIDFDDMIYLPLLFRLRFWTYDNVIVDEAQDTNAARRALVRAMLRKGGRVIAVGDPSQAINGFAGADNDALDRIKEDFNCVQMPLTVSYRCPKAVVRYAQQWAAHILPAETAIEGSVTDMTLDELLNTSLSGNDAILCRNNKPLVGLAMKLIRRRIGCKIEGKEIGAQLSNLAHRWSSIKTLEALRNKLGQYFEAQRTNLTAKKEEQKLGVIEDQVDCLQTIIGQCIREGETSIKAVDAYLEKLFGDEVKGVVTLSSIHKSKGREWNRVFWLDKEKTCPSKWARQAWQEEQEHNLMYVAATRSQNALVLVTS